MKKILFIIGIILSIQSTSSSGFFEATNQNIKSLKKNKATYIITDIETYEKTEIQELQKTNKKIIARLNLLKANTYKNYWNPEWDYYKTAPDCFVLDYDFDKGEFTYKKLCPYGIEPFYNDGEYIYVKYWYSFWYRDVILPQIQEINKKGFDGVLFEDMDDFDIIKGGNHNRLFELFKKTTRQLNTKKNILDSNGKFIRLLSKKQMQRFYMFTNGLYLDDFFEFPKNTIVKNYLLIKNLHKFGIDIFSNNKLPIKYIEQK